MPTKASCSSKVVAFQGSNFHSVGGKDALIAKLKAAGYEPVARATRNVAYLIVAEDVKDSAAAQTKMHNLSQAGTVIVQEHEVNEKLLLTGAAVSAICASDTASGAADGVAGAPAPTTAAKRPDVALIKGKEFPSVPGGIEAIKEHLKEAGFTIARADSSKVTHIIVGSEFFETGRYSWVEAAEKAGKQIVWEKMLPIFMSRRAPDGTPAAAGHKRSRRAAEHVLADDASTEAKRPRNMEMEDIVDLTATSPSTCAVGSESVGIKIFLPSGSLRAARFSTVDKVVDIKQLMLRQNDIEADASGAKLFFAGNPLDDNTSLADNKVCEGCLLHLYVAPQPTKTLLKTQPHSSPISESTARPARDPLAYAPGEPTLPAMPAGETRARKWRASASTSTLERMHRANTQTLFLIDRKTSGSGYIFDVLGSTGNVYNVTIASEVSCTCPDHARSGNPCKHIIFVLLKVLRIPSTNALAWQAAYTSNELAYIFRNAPDPSRNAGVFASQAVRVRQAVAAATRQENVVEKTVEISTEPVVNQRSIDASEPCAICFDELGTDIKKLTNCRNCGNHIHVDCINEWIKAKKRRSEDPTCPYCRSIWIARVGKADGVSHGKGSTTINEGYINVADIAGLPKSRPPSYRSRFKRRSYFRGDVIGEDFSVDDDDDDDYVF